MGPQSNQLLAADPSNEAPFHAIESVAADQADDPLIGLVQSDSPARGCCPSHSRASRPPRQWLQRCSWARSWEPLAAGDRRRLNLWWTRFAVERVGAAVLPDHQAQPNCHQRQGRQEWVADPLGAIGWILQLKFRPRVSSMHRVPLSLLALSLLNQPKAQAERAFFRSPPTRVSPS